MKDVLLQNIDDDTCINDEFGLEIESSNKKDILQDEVGK